MNLLYFGIVRLILSIGQIRRMCQVGHSTVAVIVHFSVLSFAHYPYWLESVAEYEV